MNDAPVLNYTHKHFGSNPQIPVFFRKIFVKDIAAGIIELIAIKPTKKAL